MFLDNVISDKISPHTQQRSIEAVLTQDHISYHLQLDVQPRILTISEVNEIIQNKSSEFVGIAERGVFVKDGMIVFG